MEIFEAIFFKYLTVKVDAVRMPDAQKTTLSTFLSLGRVTCVILNLKTDKGVHLGLRELSQTRRELVLDHNLCASVPWNKMLKNTEKCNLPDTMCFATFLLTKQSRLGSRLSVFHVQMKSKNLVENNQLFIKVNCAKN